MLDMKDRKQLNLRLDNEGDLLEEAKQAAIASGKSLNQFVIDAIKAALDKQLDNKIVTLDRLYGMVEELEKLYNLHSERLKAIEGKQEEVEKKLSSRQIAEKTLDNSQGDREAPGAEPKLPPPDRALDAPTAEPEVFTDAEVAKQWGCEESYIRNLRLGKLKPVPNDRDIWEYWQPVKGKARWLKLKKGLSVLHP